MSNLTEQEEALLELLRPSSVTINDIRYVPLDSVRPVVESIHTEAYSEGLKKNISDHFKDIAQLRVDLLDEVIEKLIVMRDKELEHTKGDHNEIY